MQHLLRYIARLFEEERKKKINNSDFRPIQIVILEQVLDTITVNVDWGSLHMYISSSKCL